MLAHITEVATAIDVAGHAPFDDDVGGSHEVLQTVFVKHRASLAAAIDVPIHITTLQLNVGGTSDVGFRTIAATVGITGYITTVHEVYIGLVEIVVRQDVVGIGTVVFARSIRI